MARSRRTTDDATVRGSTDVSVLMTGAGTPGATGALTGLERSSLSCRVVGVDARADAYGFDLVDEEYLVPKATDDDYLERIHTIVSREAIDVILPLTTAELSPLAQAKRALEDRGVSVMVSDPGTLELTDDKRHLYEFLHERRFAAAPTFERVSSRDGFVEAVERMGYPEEPVRIKRPVGSGMRGFRVLDQSVDRYDLPVNEKPGNGVTTLEDVLVVLEEVEPFPEFVVMEYLPVPEYSVDVVATETAIPAVVPRSRERTRAGISFAGTVERNAELIAASRAIASALDLEYNANLQFRYDGAGVPKIVEIDPKVSGTVVMCVGAGANLPAMGVRHALGLPVEEPDVAWGTSMRRFSQEVF